jgi:acetyl-CoA carboxylase carboxyl transferase subunit beta
MPIFQKRAFSSSKRKRKDIPEGLWEKCPECEEMMHQVVLVENQRVCTKCDHHFPIGARERIGLLLDPGTFTEHDAYLLPVDLLKFKGEKTYADRLKSYQEKTGLNDAVITGVGKIESLPVAIAVMDFQFIAATMGAVVGEKLARIIETGTRERMAVVIVAASGGARMYEGVFSLMQMAKTCGALALHAQARLPYISVMTHPTTGGVSASFATVGDINLAEPKAMIGFAGPRVIRETTHQDLPPNFQTAEFLEEHGLIDQIVHRKKMRATLAELIKYLTKS